MPVRRKARILGPTPMQEQQAKINHINAAGHAASKVPKDKRTKAEQAAIRRFNLIAPEGDELK